MTSTSILNRAENAGVELHIQGIVQGVGFRPFIYNLATQLQITGSVSNTSDGVFIQAVGHRTVLASFIHRIETESPPLSQIHAIDVEEVDVAPSTCFTIQQSKANSSSNTAIPADIALCEDCLRELFDPQDRRYGYPFINCTNCGPRFTIVETIPYDRKKTSMKVFPMCHQCTDEYNDPGNRRFHAQPNACHKCGPTITLHGNKGTRLNTNDPIGDVVTELNNGKIVAIRGLGGFHLCVNGYSKEAVAKLRTRKNRPSKPLAIMTADLPEARLHCHISKQEEHKLQSPEHPIVLLKKLKKEKLAENLCPGIEDIGVMLPYTPLHHLLFKHPDCPKALVMTSGNSSGKPICISNEGALDQLAHIADLFLLHNREILTRVDDSVVKNINNSFRPFRRARGFSPTPILVSPRLPKILGCGGGLKSTFCLAKENKVFLSQHIGDLFNLESFDFYKESIEHHKKVFEIEPEIVACDLHPDYMSSHYAKELSIPLYPVQHHHAHAVAVMAEHNLEGKTLGIILDGTGYGTDGTIWGGELLLCDPKSFTRLGHLEPLPLPGGDKAAEEVWRMGVSALRKAFPSKDYSTSFMPSISESKKKAILTMMENEFNSPLSSSCGRLFDAVASILDLRYHCDYEGQAAMELEALASTILNGNWKTKLYFHFLKNYPISHKEKTGWEISSSSLIKQAVDKLSYNIPANQVAMEFHFDLISAISSLAVKLATEYQLKQIVLSGGCMQNSILMEGFFYLLEKEGFQVYTGEKVPVNDGGISFGQIICGGLQHVSCNPHAGNQG